MPLFLLDSQFTLSSLRINISYKLLLYINHIIALLAGLFSLIIFYFLILFYIFAKQRSREIGKEGEGERAREGE